MLEMKIESLKKGGLARDFSYFRICSSVPGLGPGSLRYFVPWSEFRSGSVLVAPSLASGRSASRSLDRPLAPRAWKLLPFLPGPVRAYRAYPIFYWGSYGPFGWAHFVRPILIPSSKKQIKKGQLSRIKRTLDPIYCKTIYLYDYSIYDEDR